MAGIEDGIAQTLAYAADDSHGYELQCRRYGIGTDCAGLMILYAAAVEGVPLERYPNFHTWTEVSVLTARGWRDIPFSESEKRRGDILLRALGDSTGHTVLYLGNGRIVGAESNWDGVRGDSSGAEVTERSYYAYGYNHILRWEDDLTDEQARQLAEVYHQVTRTDDPTGRGMKSNDHDHIKWIAAAIQGLGDMVEDLSAKVDRLGAGTDDAEAEEK